MRTAILQRIQALDPERDHKQIVYLSTCFEFPFDTTRSLEFALFRTFCVPSVSDLLDRTGEFRQRPQKRYDDTDIIVSEMLEWGYDSDRGAAALARMNRIHGMFNISNDDFLYVLSTFVFEPIRWNARFGWRPMCDAEKLAMFYFWREVGRRMQIHSLPDDYAQFERFNQDYERRHFTYTESNRRIGEATRELFASWFPGWTRPLVRRVIHAMMDDATLTAFGFPCPSAGLRRAVAALMRGRARVVRWLPSRRRPRLRTEMAHRSYAEPYRLEQLGPPYMTERPPEQKP